MKVVSFIRKTLSFDFRTLAMYRFLMGLIVIADVVTRLPDLTNFYTDVGLVPRSTFLAEMAMPWSFSLHLANGSSGFIFALFAIHFIIGVMLVLGYKTRWAMAGAFILTASLHNRNWLINNGGDDILRAILFISIFLPLNKVFSVDSALKTKREELPESHFSTWGLAFYFQVFAIYFFSYLLKTSPIWRSDLTAIFYASRLDIFATPLGVLSRNFPLFQKATTFFTIYLEFLGPLLLVFSFVFGKFWWRVRSVTIFLFWCLHLGIILTMWIGVFPYTCLVMWSIFIPGVVWDNFMRPLKERGMGSLTIFYDGECGFCKKGVLIIREFFLLPEVQVIEAQTKKEINDHMLRENSWVVMNGKGEIFYHFHAFVEVMRHSPILRFFTWIFNAPLLRLGNFIYKWVASHRQLMSKVSQFLSIDPVPKRISTLYWLSQAAGAFILVTLIMWNLTTIKRWNVRAPFFQTVTRWLHLYQEWNMFAPFPKTDNVWVEIPATLSDDSEIELLTGSRDLIRNKSQEFYKIIPNEHWRKFYLNVSDKADYARYYAGFLCRAWNDRKLHWVPYTTLRKLEINVFSQQNLPNGDKGEILRKLTWKHWCFDEDWRRDNPKASPKN